MNLKANQPTPAEYRYLMENEIRKSFLNYFKIDNFIEDMETPPSVEEYFKLDHSSLIFATTADAFIELYGEPALTEIIADVMEHTLGCN